MAASSNLPNEAARTTARLMAKVMDDETIIGVASSDLMAFKDQLRHDQDFAGDRFPALRMTGQSDFGTDRVNPAPETDRRVEAQHLAFRFTVK